MDASRELSTPPWPKGHPKKHGLRSPAEASLAGEDVVPKPKPCQPRKETGFATTVDSDDGQQPVAWQRVRDACASLRVLPQGCDAVF